MKNKIFLHSSVLLLTLILLTTTPNVVETRGGRRGGGTFGGIFGGLRKYKKQSATGPQRRTVNGSPMHTELTKSNSNAMRASSASFPAATKTKTHTASYPRQQMPSQSSGYQPLSRFTAANLPPGGTYHASAEGLPKAAFFSAKPPMRTSGRGDFLIDMMTGHIIGHIIGHGMFGHRPYIAGIYLHDQQQTNGSEIIIINNNNNNETQVNNTQGNETHETHTAAAINILVNNEETTENAGFMCVPLLFNETDTDLNATKYVEKTVCYPAPMEDLIARTLKPECKSYTSTEIDPDDPTKTIEIQRSECSDGSTEAPPVAIAGDISDKRYINIE